MRTSIIYYFIFLFCWSFNVLAIESSKLIKLEDIEYIYLIQTFKNGIKMLFFLKKRKPWKKLPIKTQMFIH